MGINLLLLHPKYLGIRLFIMFDFVYFSWLTIIVSFSFHFENIRNSRDLTQFVFVFHYKWINHFIIHQQNRTTLTINY